MHTQAFIRKWGPGGSAHALNERAGAQTHFIDLCRVLGVPEPDDPEAYCFERGVTKTGSADWTRAMPDDEILRRLLALNLERAKLD